MKLMFRKKMDLLEDKTHIQKTIIRFYWNDQVQHRIMRRCVLPLASKWAELTIYEKQGKRKVQGIPQSQPAALPRHQEEEKTDKTK